MSSTVLGVFGSASDARMAVQDLLSHGFAENEVSLMAPGSMRHEAGPIVKVVEKGALLGGLSGFMLRLTELAVPGVGPLLLGGWIAVALLGAGIGGAAGGVVGAMTELGLSADLAHAASEAIDHGNAVVAVHLSSGRADAAEAAMARYRPDSVRVFHDTPDRAGTLPGV